MIIFAFNAVLNTGLRISKKEEKLCDELLEAAIQHWSVLKDTPIEGLRETFLIRPGKITASGKNTELWVEQKGVDILLSHLPWSIGMVKTPWMEDFIECNWY